MPSSGFKRFYPTSFIVIGCALWLASASCGSSGGSSKGSTGFFSRAYMDEDDFTTLLKKSVPAIDTTDSSWRKHKFIPLSASLPYVYMRNGYRPLWVSKKGMISYTADFLKELKAVAQDGFNPEAYNATELYNRYIQLDTLRRPDINAVLAFDTMCTHMYLKVSRDLLLGAVPVKKADSLWYHINDSAWSAPQCLVHQQSEKGAYTSLDSFRSTIPAYKLLGAEYMRYVGMQKDSNCIAAKDQVQKGNSSDSMIALIIKAEMPWVTAPAADTLSKTNNALAVYQKYYSQRITGKPDSATLSYLAQMPDSVAAIIKANLERLRWLPRKLEADYVLVNIPMMELYFHNATNDTMRMRIVVGKPERQTPVLNAAISNVVFNPSWGVPPTILKKDVLPGITQSGAHYLHKKGLRAYDREGNRVSASDINPHNYRRFTYKQPPGDDNSLGNIKFNLPNQWDIYLHDTPHKEDFPMRYRAKSSGCIRIEKPREFAEFILAYLERKNFTSGKIDTLIKTHKTKYEMLTHKIPVHIVYLTALQDSSGNHIRFYNDIYHRDAKLKALLQ